MPNPYETPTPPYGPSLSATARAQRRETLEALAAEREQASAARAAQNAAARERINTAIDARRAAEADQAATALEAALEPARIQLERQWLVDHPERTAGDFRALVWPHLRATLAEKAKASVLEAEKARLRGSFVL